MSSVPREIIWTTLFEFGRTWLACSLAMLEKAEDLPLRLFASIQTIPSKRN